MLTSTDEHINWISKYLKENNFTPFELLERNGILIINQLTFKEFAFYPGDNQVLINLDTLEKHLGYIEFKYVKVHVDYFHHWKSSYIEDNKPIEEEQYSAFHIRANNIGSYLTYHNERQKFFSMFNKRNKTKEVEYGMGYVFLKDENGKAPFCVGEEKKVITNSYYLTLNV